MFSQHRFIAPRSGFTVYADCEGMHSLDLHNYIKKDRHQSKSNGSRIVVAKEMPRGSFHEVSFGSWLPYAADPYQISPNLEDYVLTPVNIMPSDLPNRNGVAFPLAELVKFNVEHGRMAYQTLIGKPMHVEHDNQDPTKAVGVIVDAALRRAPNYGNGKVWKLIALLAMDRTKNPVLASKILAGEQNSYSMGSWVGTIESEPGYSCSYCHAPMGQCRHLHPDQPFDFYTTTTAQGLALVFRNVHNVVFFETSSVATPAFSTAISDYLMRW